MMVIRPVRTEDLDRLTELANIAGFGLTSLPKDRELLRGRIQDSLDSFRRTSDKPRGEIYIFVMEDLEAGLVVGTSCIISKVGGFEPFYAYRVEQSVHQSDALEIRRQIPTLHLVAEHSGPSEIGGLYLAPDYRKHGNGRLLSLFRFLFMSEHPQRFEPLVIAEMRGVVTPEGVSPFWEAIGRHFFDMDYPKADLMSIMDKKFIADLMPRCPVYVPLLPASAQEVIGQVHEHTKPALKMLGDEGFTATGMVDIFEAGPIIMARLDSLRIVKESGREVVVRIVPQDSESREFIITNTGTEFRACMGQVEHLPDGGVAITERTATVLGVDTGHTVCFAPTRSSVARTEQS
jgi:arginine N-succinyltransferase